MHIPAEQIEEQNPTHSPNAFQKPASTTFTFNQKRHNKAGELVDEDGNSVYIFKDTSEEHTFGFVKSYPLEVYHATDETLALTIDWRSSPRKTIVSGLYEDDVAIMGTLMDEEWHWEMPDGSWFEWDGVYGDVFRLLDHRPAQTYSLMPAVVAVYTPRTDKNDFSTVEVLDQALNVPNFLDHLLATVFWLEYSYYHLLEKEGASQALKAGLKLGKLGSNLGE